MNRRGVRAGVLAGTLVLLACSPVVEEPESEGGGGAAPLSVYVVNEPLRYIAERIGGEHVDVVFPAPPEVDPAYWSPDPETVSAFQGADLILLNGAGYAAWVKRASLPRRKLVDTSSGFADRLLPVEQAVTHHHGPTGAHSHEGTAFTTWLDPGFAALQARSIADAFAAARPEHEGSFRAGLSELEAELRALDDQLARAASALGSAPILFSHPVYGYPARRYDLNGVSLHWEPNEPPDEKMWRELEQLHGEHPARWMLWEAAPLPETRDRLGAMGIESLVVAPCGNTCGADDFMSAMRASAARLTGAWAKPGRRVR